MNVNHRYPESLNYRGMMSQSITKGDVADGAASSKAMARGLRVQESITMGNRSRSAGKANVL